MEILRSAENDTCFDETITFFLATVASRLNFARS
jgi:hypothetical protein